MPDELNAHCKGDRKEDRPTQCRPKIEMVAVNPPGRKPGATPNTHKAVAAE